ncbi:hypothetical protein I552_2782 [Mycobacterium xenopi 3993]|nr:hypothetical protein I552_2782 [Mycobacterium xenopi 3993]
MQQDFGKTAAVANIYADAATDLTTAIDNVPTISKTIVDQQSDLNDTLLAAIGVSNTVYDTLAPAEQNLIDAIKRFRARSRWPLTTHPNLAACSKASTAVSRNSPRCSACARRDCSPRRALCWARRRIPIRRACR